MPSHELPEYERIEAFNVANIILAELPESIKDPSEINRAARKAAKRAWRYYADKTREEVEKLDKDALNPEIWVEQVNDKDEQTFDVIPIYSAWVPLGTDYQKARKRLMRLLSGRKIYSGF